MTLAFVFCRGELGLESAVSCSIMNCLGDFHVAPPEGDSWDFVSQESLVYDIFPICSIKLAS